MGNAESSLRPSQQDRVLTKLAEIDCPLYSSNGYNSTYTEFERLLVNEQRFTALEVQSDTLMKICTQNPDNFKNLITFTTLRIIEVSSLSPLSITEWDILQVNIKILTQLLPISYQSAIINKITSNDHSPLWNIPNDSLQPLGNQLCDACVRLLMIPEITLPSQETNNETQTLLWENGLMSSNISYLEETPFLDSNRLQVINLLLSLCSMDLYSHSIDPQYKNNNAIRYLRKCNDLEVLTASIINVFCRFCNNIPETKGNSYNRRENKRLINMLDDNAKERIGQLPQLKLQFVLSSLQFLNLILSSNNDDQENTVIQYLSCLRREFDFKLILTSIVKIYKQPIDAAIEDESNLFAFNTSSPRKQPQANYIQDSSSNGTSINRKTSSNGSNDSNEEILGSKPDLPSVSPLLLSCLMFLTHLTRSNKLFMNYFADKFAHKFITFAIYYLKFYNNTVESSTTIIPLLGNLVMVFSAKSLVLYKMLQPINMNYYTNKFPSFYKISGGSNYPLTFRDFCLIQLSQLAIVNIKENTQPDPLIYELIYNLMPINKTFEVLNSGDQDHSITEKNSREKKDNSTDELIPLSLERTKSSTNSHGNDIQNTSHQRLSYNASMSIVHLLACLSNRPYLTSYSRTKYNSNSKESPNFNKSCYKSSYLNSPGFKLDTLSILLRSILSSITFCPDESVNILFALSRHSNVLISVYESVQFISKLLQHNSRTANGKRVLTIHDYVSFRTLNVPNPMKDAFLARNQIGELGSHQNLKIYDDDEKNGKGTNNQRYFRTESNADLNETTNEEDGNVNLPYLTQEQLHVIDHIKDSISEDEGTGKPVELHQYADIMHDQMLCLPLQDEAFQLRPRWPIGINYRSKIKASRNCDISKLWSGNDSLKALIKIVKIVLNEFPNITKIKSKEYQALLALLCDFEEELNKRVLYDLPIQIRRTGSPKPLTMEKSIHSSSVIRRWHYVLLWSEIFNTHSSAVKKYAVTRIATEEGTVITKDVRHNISREHDFIESSNSISHQIEPSDQNASFPSYIGHPNPDGGLNNTNVQDMHMSAPIHWHEVHDDIHPNSKSNNKGNTSINSFPFFNMPWTGFNKNKSKMDSAEDSTHSNKLDINQTQCANPFNFDPSVLQPNIWTGTEIKLFALHMQKTEEYSLFDMTSSFFRKLKMGNSSSSNINQRKNISSGNGTPLSTTPYFLRG